MKRMSLINAVAWFFKKLLTYLVLLALPAPFLILVIGDAVAPENFWGVVVPMSMIVPVCIGITGILTKSIADRMGPKRWGNGS